MPIHVATPGLHCVSFRKAVIHSAASVILAVGRDRRRRCPNHCCRDDGQPSHQTRQSHPMAICGGHRSGWHRVSHAAENY